MPALIAVLVFIVVALAVFAAGSLIDQRNARGLVTSSGVQVTPVP